MVIKMTLQNLVDFCQGAGLPDPFSGATVPAPLDVNTVKSAIMVRCGLLTPLYGEPETFTNLVTQWFTVKQWTFEHLIKIIQAEYSPIENVSELRNEKTKYGHNSTKTGGYKDTEAGKDTEAHSGTDTEAHSGTDSTAHTGTDTTTNEISAFDSTGYQADNKSSLGYGHNIGLTHGESIGTTHGESIDTTYGHNVTRVYNSEKDQEGGVDEHIVSRHGNIGVTTNQRMIEEELELLRHFDIYTYIAELFENDNMLMIY